VATTLGVFELAAVDQSFTEVQLQQTPTAAPVSVPATDLLLDTASADPAKHLLWVAQTRAGPVLSRRAGPASATNYLVPAADVGLPAASGSRAKLARCTTHPEVVYLAIATSWTSLALYRTTNAPAGDTVPATTAWTALTAPAPSDGILQAPYNLVLEVHPQLKDTVYLGESRLWRTTSGGVAAGGGANPWEQCGRVTTASQGIHWDQHALAIDPGTGTAGTFDGIGLWAGNDGGIWRSTDGGTNFGHRNRGLQTLQFFQVASHPTVRTVLVAGAQDNGVLRADGSGAWLEISQGDGCYVSIDPGEPMTWYQGYVSYPGRGQPGFTGFQGIERSTTAGAIGSFGVVAGPSPTRAGTTDSIDPNDDALFYAPFVVVPSSTPGTHGEVWVGTDKLYRSGDRGSTGQQGGPTLMPRAAAASPSTARGVSSIAFAPGHPERIYVGTSNGRLFRFDQPSGGSWPTGSALTVTELTALPPPSGSPPGTPPTNVLAQADPTAAGRFVSDIAVTRVGANDRVVVALGLNHITGGPGPAPPSAAVSLAISETNGEHFDRLVVDTLTFADGSTLDGMHNYANAVAIDPQRQDVVYVGCDVGVFRYQVGTDPAPQAWNQGLPNAPVLDLDVWPRTGTATPRVIRAATHGRGIYEAELDATSGHTADVFLRDILVDDGRDALVAETAPDPFSSGATLHASASPDVKLESEYFSTGTPTRGSTLDYTATGPLDFIGFAELQEGALVGDRSSTVWVQVHNRGPQPATNVRVRAFWAHKSGDGYPALPSGFWTGFPTSDPPTSDWQAVGPAVTIAAVRAGEPALASWSWDLPDALAGDAALLVAVDSAEDVFVPPASTDPAEAARQSKYVALRDVSTRIPTWEIVVLILVGVGVAAGVAGGIYAATR
jgi:hypothetical protein